MDYTGYVTESIFSGRKKNLSFDRELWLFKFTTISDYKYKEGSNVSFNGFERDFSLKFYNVIIDSLSLKHNEDYYKMSIQLGVFGSLSFFFQDYYYECRQIKGIRKEGDDYLYQDINNQEVMYFSEFYEWK
ncbi:hypothetical protein QNI19_18805 [Cytophagaceae bacterium DM2B3-1]|uniref:Uncharacterized protein n=1 Tax=Xanthocytophaga flava TaxID=3048013 RepID=A0ABT7CMM7_9BACT|nr:hypothetical protein [Xanthocytophaga flavus]MDJ1494996.1 hypothetical protein [Xanthocytophaga flavus]